MLPHLKSSQKKLQDNSVFLDTSIESNVQIVPLDRAPLLFPSWLLASLPCLLYRTLADSLNVGGGLLANDKGGTGWWKEWREQALKGGSSYSGSS